MKPLIKIGVQNSCTPVSLFVPPTLPVKGYKNPHSKISVDTLIIMAVLYLTAAGTRCLTF